MRRPLRRLHRLVVPILSRVRFVRMVTWLLAVSVIVGPRAMADDQKAARQLLQSRSLTNVGRQWICTDDMALRRQLDRLDFLAKQVRDSEAQVEQLIERNETVQVELRRVEAALKQAHRIRSQNGAISKERIKALEQRRDQLRKQHLSPDEFCGAGEVRSAVVQLSSARQRLAILVTSAPAEIVRIRGIYAALGKDPEVKAALAVIGDGNRLAAGSLSAKYESRIARVQRMAHGQWVPMYCDNGHYRVAALLSDRTPVTLTYQPGSGPGLLPDSVLQKAGIRISEDVPQEIFEPGDGRRLTVRPIKIEYLRLGPHLLEDVPFYALPPEGEDLGGRVTSETLSGHSARPVPELLRLELPPTN